MAATVLIEMHGPYEFPDAPTVTFWSARLLRSEDGVTECIGSVRRVMKVVGKMAA